MPRHLAEHSATAAYQAGDPCEYKGIIYIAQTLEQKQALGGNGAVDYSQLPSAGTFDWREAIVGYSDPVDILSDLSKNAYWLAPQELDVTEWRNRGSAGGDVSMGANALHGGYRSFNPIDTAATNSYITFPAPVVDFSPAGSTFIVVAFNNAGITSSTANPRMVRALASTQGFDCYITSTGAVRITCSDGTAGGAFTTTQTVATGNDQFLILDYKAGSFRVMVADSDGVLLIDETFDTSARGDFTPAVPLTVFGGISNKWVEGTIGDVVVGTDFQYDIPALAAALAMRETTKRGAHRAVYELTTLSTTASDRLDVRDFGAVMRNGADIRPAILAAIEHAGDKRRTIYIPANDGMAIISDKVDLRNCVIEGSGISHDGDDGGTKIKFLTGGFYSSRPNNYGFSIKNISIMGDNGVENNGAWPTDAEAVARANAPVDNPAASFTEFSMGVDLAPDVGDIPTELDALAATLQEQDDLAGIHFNDFSVYYYATPWVEVARVVRTNPLNKSGQILVDFEGQNYTVLTNVRLKETDTAIHILEDTKYGTSIESHYSAFTNVHIERYNTGVSLPDSGKNGGHRFENGGRLWQGYDSSVGFDIGAGVNDIVIGGQYFEAGSSLWDIHAAVRSKGSYITLRDVRSELKRAGSGKPAMIHVLAGAGPHHFISGTTSSGFHITDDNDPPVTIAIPECKWTNHAYPNARHGRLPRVDNLRVMYGNGNEQIIDADAVGNIQSGGKRLAFEDDPNEYADDTAAAAGGVGVGFLYKHVSGLSKIRMV